jgi:DNA-binding NarL/FixJ family response regulator
MDLGDQLEFPIDARLPVDGRLRGLDQRPLAHAQLVAQVNRIERIAFEFDAGVFAKRSSEPTRKSLTVREKDVLTWVARGETSAEIATILLLSERRSTFTATTR